MQTKCYLVILYVTCILVNNTVIKTAIIVVALNALSICCVFLKNEEGDG